MNKVQLRDIVSYQTGISRQDTMKVITTFLNTVKTTINAGGQIELRKFGRWKNKTRKSKRARNLSTGETIYIPEHKAIVFEVAKEWQGDFNQ